MHRIFHEETLEEMIRRLFCRAFCHEHHKPRAVVTLRFGDGQSITFQGDFMSTVKDDGGPFNADVSAFIDDKKNPTTDKDIPVYSSSMLDVATVAANDPAGPDPQGAVITLTGKLTDPAAPCVINADFNGGDANKVNGGFSVVGTLQVVASAAVSAVMSITGPGIVPDA